MAENNDKDHDEGVTFINVFELPRDDLDAFLTGWRRLAGIMAAAPGFRDAALHEAVSGEARFQLVNVAHWDSEQAWRDAATNPEMQAAAQRMGADLAARRVGQYPGLYRVAAAFSA